MPSEKSTPRIILRRFSVPRNSLHHLDTGKGAFGDEVDGAGAGLLTETVGGFVVHTSESGIGTDIDIDIFRDTYSHTCETCLNPDLHIFIEYGVAEIKPDRAEGGFYVSTVKLLILNTMIPLTESG